MKNIILCISRKENLVSIIMCILSFLCFILFFLAPFFMIKPKKIDDNISQNKLKIVNNVIYWDTIELYRFIPIEGGEQVLGGWKNVQLGSKSGTLMAKFYTSQKIHVNSFLIGETEVPFSLWEAVMNNRYSSDAHLYNNNAVYDKKYSEWELFISKLDSLTDRVIRVPTNSEWEFAARGGIHSKGYKYSGSNDLDEVAFYEGNTPEEYRKMSPILIKSKKPNELGLYDMSGGVWEFTSSLMKDIDSDLTFYGDNAEDYYNLQVPRGGSRDSDEHTCSLDTKPFSVWVFAGMRLVLEY